MTGDFLLATGGPWSRTGARARPLGGPGVLVEEDKRAVVPIRDSSLIVTVRLFPTRSHFPSQKSMNFIRFKKLYLFSTCRREAFGASGMLCVEIRNSGQTQRRGPG